MSDQIAEGPYLLAAFLCEKVLEEKDGVKTAVRIVDRVTRQALESNPPSELKPFGYKITLLIMMKSGSARGVYDVVIRLVQPSGESSEFVRQAVHFEGEEDRGVDIVGNLDLKIEMQGLHWFEILLGDELLTRCPLRVIYLPQRQVKR